MALAASHLVIECEGIRKNARPWRPMGKAEGRRSAGVDTDRAADTQEVDVASHDEQRVRWHVQTIPRQSGMSKFVSTIRTCNYAFTRQRDLYLISLIILY
jgi:hypothetical protein